MYVEHILDDLIYYLSDGEFSDHCELHKYCEEKRRQERELKRQELVKESDSDIIESKSICITESDN